MSANIDQISNGRFSLNIVSALVEQEMREYGGAWVGHDERYERTREFLEVMRGVDRRGIHLRRPLLQSREGAPRAEACAQTLAYDLRGRRI